MGLNRRQLLLHHGNPSCPVWKLSAWQQGFKGRRIKQQWWFIGHLLNSIVNCGAVWSVVGWNSVGSQLGSLPTQLRFHVLGVEAELTTFRVVICSCIRKQQWWGRTFTVLKWMSLLHRIDLIEPGQNPEREKESLSTLFCPPKFFLRMDGCPICNLSFPKRIWSAFPNNNNFLVRVPEVPPQSLT